MKKLSQFSVNYPITVVMMVMAVLLLGYISFQKLGMDLFPDISNPTIYVELEAGEMPPEEIERKYVENIESLSIRLKDVIGVESVSRVGSAHVTVEYAWKTQMDEAFLELQKALADIESDSDIDDFSITQYDPNAAPIILLALSHPEIDDMDELRRTAESYLRNELIRIEGIADVRILGQEEKEVVISTDRYTLEAYGLTPSALSSRISEYNRNISGGSIYEMGLQYTVKGVGEYQSLDDIRNIVVAYMTSEAGERQGESSGDSETSEQIPVLLSDVATVSFRNHEPDNMVTFNGKRCIGLGIYKEMKFNTVQAVDAFMESLDGIGKALPGYELTVVKNQGDFIISAIDEVKETALLGVLLAVIILFIFLGKLGATAVISLAIPISIVATFNLMYFNDLTLNIMTLGGLALGAGMLVDNAIVVLENIFRNMESGMSVKEAAIEGSSQVGGAITASTLTTIVVFLPIVYLQGSAGELFKDQAWTVAFSLISSLIVAILVIPMLASRLLKSSKSSFLSRAFSFSGYASFLRKALKLRWPIILISVVLVAASVHLIPLIGSEFLPKTDTSEFSIELTLPEGTELDRTAGVARGIEQAVLDVLGDQVEMVFSISGPSGDVAGNTALVFEDENTAVVRLFLKDDHTASSTTVLTALGAIVENVPDVEANIIQEQAVSDITLGGSEAPVVIEIRGEELDILEELANNTSEALSSIESLSNIEVSFEEGRPQIDVVIDRIRAGIQGVGIETVSSQLSNRLSGVESGQMESEGELKDILIELPDLSVSDIENISIDNGSNDIYLYEIADIRNSRAPKEIVRTNQSRVGKVSAHIAGDAALDHVVNEIKNAMATVDFPSDYRYEITGEEQERKQAFATLQFALILSLILVYMVLASQFESLVHPFTIILSIPLAVVGALALFFILGKTLNIMAFIGIIMLVGIAVNDSIILVDAINQLKREGYSRMDAIVEAGKRRIRPIIMTSLTTIMALLPLTLGIGEGASLRAPMALAVIGGLVTSTILTLVVIPCVYSVLDIVSRDPR